MKEKIKDYMDGLNRANFIDSSSKKFAKNDEALSIGYGQTISQPSLVFKMSVLLELNDEAKVLEIGTGSGFQTAILAKFSKEVYTIEIIEKLSIKAKKRLTRMGFKNINYFIKDASDGLEEHAPYDRIIVTAAARVIPNELIEQLAIGGIMIIPVGEKHIQNLILVKKENNGNIKKEVIELVRFVEYKGKYGWN